MAKLRRLLPPSRGPGYRDLYVPPLFGWPKKQNVDYPSTIPSNIFLVRLDDRYNQNPEPLRIQVVPEELSVQPTANWAVVPSLGRNNPFYHYTGGEDTLQFTLDWYAVTERRQDVIDKCRWVESLCKADGYLDEPPRVLLIFGELFKSTTWIIKEAPYRLKNFNRERMMFPQQAYQELTLAKVTSRNSGTLERQYFG